MAEFNADVALEQFRRRRDANKGKTRINNSDLPAGSPMYYYCRFCQDRTAVLPESHICAAPTICRPCEVLYDHGLLPERK